MENFIFCTVNGSRYYKKTLGSTGPSDLDTDAWSRILNSENFGTSRDEFEKSKSKYD